jgi:hypothetical protein
MPSLKYADWFQVIDSEKSTTGQLNFSLKNNLVQASKSIVEVCLTSVFLSSFVITKKLSFSLFSYFPLICLSDSVFKVSVSPPSLQIVPVVGVVHDDSCDSGGDFFFISPSSFFFFLSLSLLSSLSLFFPPSLSVNAVRIGASTHPHSTEIPSSGGVLYLR